MCVLIGTSDEKRCALSEVVTRKHSFSAYGDLANLVEGLLHKHEFSRQSLQLLTPDASRNITANVPTIVDFGEGRVNAGGAVRVAAWGHGRRLSEQLKAMHAGELTLNGLLRS